MNITRSSFPTPIHFGAGARKLVARHLLDAGCKRPLIVIVTDKAVSALPVLAEFRTHLAGLEVPAFAGVFGNPTASQAMSGAVASKSSNYEASQVIHSLHPMPLSLQPTASCCSIQAATSL